VFLYRAGIFGALDMADEHEGVISLVGGFMTVLDSAASSDCHIARRYSRLLKSLWFPYLQHTSADTRTVQIRIDGNADRTTTSAQKMSKPNTAEESQIIDPEDQEGVLEMTNFDPFCGSFSGFEADIFGSVPQEVFGFQGLDSNLL
jgi:hypothetical protein